MTPAQRTAVRLPALIPPVAVMAHTAPGPTATLLVLLAVAVGTWASLPWIQAAPPLPDDRPAAPALDDPRLPSQQLAAPQR